MAKRKSKDEEIERQLDIALSGTLLAVDWGNGRKTTFCYRNPSTGVLEIFPFDGSLFDFISMQKNVSLILEKTYESRARKKHNHIIELAAQNNITLLPISPRRTDGYRSRKGIEKSDVNDSFAIYLIGEDKIKGGIPFKKLLPLPEKSETTFNKFDIIRQDNYPKKAVDEILSCLPSFKSLEKPLKEALGDSTKYSHGFVIPYVLLAKDVLATGGGRKEYLKGVGNHEDGFQCFNRSTFYRRVGTVENRLLDELDLDRTQLKDTGKKKSLVRLNEEAWLPIHKESMNKVSKAVRWIFYQVKNDFLLAAKQHSEKDKPDAQVSSERPTSIPKRTRAKPSEQNLQLQLIS